MEMKLSPSAQHPNNVVSNVHKQDMLLFKPFCSAIGLARHAILCLKDAKTAPLIAVVRTGGPVVEGVVNKVGSIPCELLLAHFRLKSLPK